MNIKSTVRPDYDELIQRIADYVLKPSFGDEQLAMTTARLAFFDALGCGLLALSYPECTKLLGPVVPGANLANGVKIPGCNYSLDPQRAAFNIGSMIRWLDYNDTWLAAEWGHPSDNLGSIWAMAEYISRQNVAKGKAPLTLETIIKHMIMAYEIQGVIALQNSFNKMGLDHVLLVRIASTAVVCSLNGCSRDEILAALSNAWIDGSALRTYRHAPNAGTRKSWAAGDACARAVFLSLMAKKGEMGCPSALTAKIWGFQDVAFGSKDLQVEQSFGSYVMENILFKVSYPAEFHAQTAVECAIQLYPEVVERWQDIKTIHITTHQSAIRIIDKVGPLHNPADRDHCLQYMIAVPLMKGSLDAMDYEDKAAANPLIDELRSKMVVVEDPQMSADYLDPEKRSIANAIKIEFADGSFTKEVRVDYPLGHKIRRSESLPHLQKKFSFNVASRLSTKQCDQVSKIVFDHNLFLKTTINDFSDLLALD